MQPGQESIFRTIFAGRVTFWGIFRRFLRATTRRVKKVKILATPMRTVLWFGQHADQNWYALYSDVQYENIAVSHYNQVHLVDHEHLSIIQSGVRSPRQQQQQQQPGAARHHADSLNDAGIQELHTWGSNYRAVCLFCNDMLAHRAHYSTEFTPGSSRIVVLPSSES